MTTLYIVWNHDKTEGYVTREVSIAYEVRKGADSNCYNGDGQPMKLARAFCELTADEDCTIEEIKQP